MQNVSFPRINWSIVKHVVFDMDGTVYDEFQSVEQVYSKIIEDFKRIDKLDAVGMKDYMLTRWMNKGSSYPKIFEEVHVEFLKGLVSREEFVTSCLATYRHFSPRIQICSRAIYFLELMIRCNSYSLYLVTDGAPTLQYNKIRSLGLDTYFDKKRIFVTGDYGKDYYKPSSKILEKMKLPRGHEVVYFGDREIDEQFATNNNWQFQRVFLMKDIL